MSTINRSKDLRPQAIYFRLFEKGDSKDAPIPVSELLKTLEGLKASYAEFVKCEYEKINTQTDGRKLKKIYNLLVAENELKIVDLKFSSCVAALVPDINLYTQEIPRILNPLHWKKNAFEIYKNDVLKADVNSTSFLKGVASKYTPAQRRLIFEPFLNAATDRNRTIVKFGIGSPTFNIHISKPSPEACLVLMPTSESDEIPESVKVTKTIAMVETRNNKRHKVLDLFNNEISTPILPIDYFEIDGIRYELEYPIYFVLEHDVATDMYSLASEEFGIYAYGASLEEAKQALNEELGYIYEMYNSHTDDQMTMDVKRIKDKLNQLVIR